MREYKEDVPVYADLFTVLEFNDLRRTGAIIEDDGSGNWVKDNKMSKDEVFCTEAEDATHVAWFNK